MDAILTSTLLEQINERKKGDGDFKTQAYQAVVDKLRIELSISVTVDHVRNRIKVWKKHYAVISEIRTYTKFKWDEERKMAVFPIEDLSAWKLYCQIEQRVRRVQQHEESVDAMYTEIEGASTSENSSGGSNKRLKRDRLTDAISSFAESFKEYVSRAKILQNRRIMNGMVDEFDMLKNVPRSKN
ncbi:Speckle targeted PIP5K1A-regulated poly(A) polymerase [Bienertia sinuspersici]